MNSLKCCFNQLVPTKNCFHFFKKLKYSHLSKLEPCGFDSGLNIYNSIIKKKVRFLTKRNKIVTWYCCGPTVYDSAHIGNFCSFMRFDIIRRIMRDYFNLNVIMVMNITDIDDKIITRSRELDIDIKRLTDLCEREFFADLKSLNILPPTVVARVTDHIPDIIDFIQSLVDRGYGYSTPDGSVYFPVSKYSGYGKFQPKVEEEVASSGSKENKEDFVLWKAAKAGEPAWDSPWGSGRPGWHIECSTIACKFLGDTIDLHSGGVDLKFPHHENEEAQCCARNGQSQWVNYWMHSGHLYTKAKEKMSKSLNNTTSIKEFLSHHTANTLRMFCLIVPYRNDVEFRPETIQKASAIERKCFQFVSELQSYLRGEGETRGNIDEVNLFQKIDETERAIRQSLSNDFDTSRAVTELLNLISTTHSMLQASTTVPTPGSVSALAAVENTVQRTLQSLGFSLASEEGSVAKSAVEDILTSTLNFRSKIREVALGISQKDSQELVERKKALLGACDTLRDELLNAGIELKDQGKTTRWNYSEGGRSKRSASG